MPGSIADKISEMPPAYINVLLITLPRFIIPSLCDEEF